MSTTGYCNESTCTEGSTKLYECQCCSQFVCSQHRSLHFMADMIKKADKMVHDFVSVSNECIPEIVRKNQQGQHEQQLVDQTISLNREGGIIINVDLPTSSDIISPPENVLPAPEDVLPPIKSTIKRKSPDETHELRTSKRLKAKKESTEMDDQFNTSRVEKSFVKQCPLTADGAFGLFTTKHQIDLCLPGRTYTNLLSHLKDKHKLKKDYAKLLHDAIENGNDPGNTTLFDVNEQIIDHDRFIQCPLTNDMINLIECRPELFKNMPCQKHVMNEKVLQRHLQLHHGLTSTMATQIYDAYKTKLKKNCI
ncbi:unnamed protein product [Adineta steineri]|uniref:Uncharacterized protein n=1 Tax=Adineta steineri TaxID=433720 RepID=A0A814UCJ8_9BILA|nr:unnamed protein product [Adineta steineri]CAF1404357.1 unnamed protein product [Adineta steineri]